MAILWPLGIQILLFFYFSAQFMRLYCGLIIVDLNNKSMSCKVLIIAITLIFLCQIGSPAVYSAMRMCDSESCEIDLTYTEGIYNLTVSNVYLKSHTTMSFCIRSRPVTNDTNGACSLIGYDQSYNCLLVKSSITATFSITLDTYQADPTLAPINGTYVTNPNLTHSISLSTVSIVISTLMINTIYQMVVGNSQNLSTDLSTVLGYFHTFRVAGVTSYTSTGLIMQRHFECFQYYVNSKYNFNLIFYGGVLRNGQNVMFLNFVSFLSSGGSNMTVDTTSKLNMWGAIDFSTSHAARDMVGFSSGYGYTYDLFSLYASAPFNDTSININGTNDYVQTFSSNQDGGIPSFIAAGGYRLYDTTDTNGDEIIRKKINYNFCYAVGYSTSTTVAIQPTDRIKHNFVNCWIPNITVWEYFMASKGGLFILLLFAYFI